MLLGAAEGNIAAEPGRLGRRTIRWTVRQVMATDGLLVGQSPEQFRKRRRGLVVELLADMLLDRFRVDLPGARLRGAAFSVITTHWPRASSAQGSRVTSPSFSSRSSSRERLYCASSVSFSISNGRKRPSAARESSSSTSYQASGGQSAGLQVLLDRAEHARRARG